MENLVVVFPVTVFFLILLWYFTAYRLFRPNGDALPPKISAPEIGKSRYHLSKIDLKPILIITIMYAIIAFFMLGDMTAPESVREYNSGEKSVFDFGEVVEIHDMAYFTSLHTGGYTFEHSMDGKTWEQSDNLSQKYNQLFKWIDTNLWEPVTAQYVRLKADSRLDLAEVVFVLADGSTPVPKYDEADAALFDEQELYPENGPSYMNSTYFDEIYHPRTALEHIKDVTPYEVSHPPLGKIIISIGIQIFGMNPFGWRFMGTLFGVLMLPILYILLKLMFGSVAAATCATFIFAFDFMHFVQTRIATIDTYGVFFTLVSFLFMFLFVREDPEKSPIHRRLLPLGLCGVFWGIGCACKWTVIYAGAGLGIIWLGYWLVRGLDMKRRKRLKRFFAELSQNILFCLVFFVAIPLTIYYVSYYPYGTAAGMSGVSMFFNKEYFDIVLENQKFMFSYHADLESTHPYASRWWQWIIDARPILYYLNHIDGATKSALGAFNGPILCWSGFIAMLYMGYRTVRKRDFTAFMILIGYLASLVPWIVISRLTFAYHYFPCMLFLSIALCYVFALIIRQTPRWRLWVYSLSGAAAILFIAFYPVLTGIPFSTKYTSLLKWFPGAWPF